jgi:hypothetical protein
MSGTSYRDNSSTPCVSAMGDSDFVSIPPLLIHSTVVGNILTHMTIIHFKFKGTIHTKYQYEQGLRDNLLNVIDWYLRKDLDVNTKLMDNDLKFSTTLFYYSFTDRIKSLFHFALDGGEIIINDDNGKLSIEYKVKSIRGFIILYLILLFIGFIALSQGFDSEKIYIYLLSLVVPLIFLFISRLISLRLLNIVFEKSLKDRYFKFKN